jgi:L-serine dehydratase
VLADVTKWLKDKNINIAFMRVFRKEQGQDAITIIETDTIISEYDEIIELNSIYKVVWLEKEYISDNEKMAKILSVMRSSVKQGLINCAKTESGMSGGDAALMKKALDTGIIPDDLINTAAVYALAVAEENARMGRIVAAPTAGASGILPGVLIALSERNNFDDKSLINALFVAGNIGLYIANHASLSGAKGGCQAECGSAAAMAAAAMIFLYGGDEETGHHAAAIALKSALGLVCDPVGGLVEVPCIKRNANLAAVAITSANMALSGIKSFIPFKEVVGAMKQVGSAIPKSLRETAGGGLAVTPTGKEYLGDCASCN